MRNILPIVLLLHFFAAPTSSGQNLVLNPGFETFSTCPGNTSLIVNATGWNTSSLSPDYFHSCNGNGTVVGVPNNICGFQQPYSGDGYIGALCYGSFASSYLANFREFSTGTLTTPLVPGATYNVSFNVVRMNESSHTVDHLGAKFMMNYVSNLGITNSAHVFSLTSVVDTLNWTTISGTFVADSAYNFIVIGNHFDDAISIATSVQPVTFGWNAYYFIDEVSVELANQVPTAVFTAPNHICPGTCTDFTNLSLNATSYSWTFNGANPSTSTDPNPTTICYNTPGNYSVELIATNATGSDTLLLPNYITVYPFPLPQGILQSGDTLFANAGAISYQWYLSGNLIPGATDYFYVAPVSGDYNVVCTDDNGCEVEAGIFDVLASIPSDFFEGISFFPNPVTDELTIDNLEVLSGRGILITVYNPIGENVFSFWNDRLTTIDCSLLPPGIYFLQVSSDDKIYRNKFIKQ